MAGMIGLRRFHASILAAFLLGAPLATHAAQRTFVSTGGNDLNVCSLVSPCRAFARAITVTDPGGELVVLDSGGYGSVSVNRNVTIVSPAGVYAGISVLAATDGITVVAPATKVVLRGLTINGQGGINGIRIQAGEVHIENVVISNLLQAGIMVEGGSMVRISGTVARSNADGLRVDPSAGTVQVLVRDSEFSNNVIAGISAQPTAGASAMMTVERSSVTRNGVGVSASPAGIATATIVLTQSVASENGGAGVAAGGTTGTMYVRESAVTRNGVGLFQAGSGVLNACGANLLVANGLAQSGTINVNAAACLDQVTGGGTVTNVATGTGLTGGPITTTGTINLATTQLLPTVACSTNQIPQWNGSAWTCAAAVGTGTVTSVATGTGLTGGPITGSGTINLASTNLLPAVACAATQIPKWSGSAWTCAADNDTNSGGTVTSITAGSGLTGGTITTSGTIAVDPASTTLTSNFFKQGGNAFGATAVLGTTDGNPVEIHSNGSRVMRYQPDATSPNIVGGHPANSVAATFGQTVAGGGRAGSNCYEPLTGTNIRSCANSTLEDYATIGGGLANTAIGVVSTVAGGGSNTAGGDESTVGGGTGNRAGSLATVAGGGTNYASGFESTIAGGVLNRASGVASTVAGGHSNTASGYTSFAAGRRAKTQTADVTPTVHAGAFVWADSQDIDYNSNGDNTFNIRASGGVFVSPDTSLTFSPQTRQMLNLYGGTWGIGVQSSTQYFRTGNFFGWYQNGTHSDSSLDPGAGGTMLMALRPSAIATPAASGHVYAASFNVTSDRAAKQDFAAIDAHEVLDRVAALPIATWAYRTDPGIRHVGPVAQDFHAAFGVGGDDRTISTVDAAGVALVAIQGLNQKLDETHKANMRKDAQLLEQQAEIDALKRSITEMRKTHDGEIAELRRAVEVLLVRTSPDGKLAIIQ